MIALMYCLLPFAENKPMLNSTYWFKEFVTPRCTFFLILSRLAF